MFLFLYLCNLKQYLVKEKNAELFRDVIWVHISNVHKICFESLEHNEEKHSIDLLPAFSEMQYGFKLFFDLM